MPPCRSSCFLRSIQRRNKRELENYLETLEDLEDLHFNEPTRRELMRQKIVHVDAQIRELTRRAYNLQNCLDNGCDDCYPGSGNRFNIWSKTTSRPQTEVKYTSLPDKVTPWFAVACERGQQTVSPPKYETTTWRIDVQVPWHTQKTGLISNSTSVVKNSHISLYCYFDLSLTLYNM